MADRCPGCGELLPDGERHLSFSIDLYEIIARWLVAYSNEPLPPGCGYAELADNLRRRLNENGREHDRLIAAAMATTQYVGDQIVSQYEMQQHYVAGHA